MNRAEGAAQPKHAPYIFHVKDEQGGELKQEIQKNFRAPYFFNDPVNTATANSTFEVWFSPGREAGAKAHNDGYCESVMSVQLTGPKRWRFMLTPEQPTIFESFDEFDGGIYPLNKWDPEFDSVNQENGAIVFPPGYAGLAQTARPARVGVQVLTHSPRHAHSHRLECKRSTPLTPHRRQRTSSPLP